ncbi:unnamed protein product, partial [Brassica oleracea]
MHHSLLLSMYTDLQSTTSKLGDKFVKQLKDNRTIYESYVPMKYKRYYKRMAKLGEWGDHITLQPAADRFAATIWLLTSFIDTCFIEILPQDQAPKRGETPEYISFILHSSLLDLNAAVPGSAEAKEKTLVVLESKPLTWTTSSYYFLSIVHKPTVSDAL